MEFPKHNCVQMTDCEVFSTNPYIDENSTQYHFVVNSERQLKMIRDLYLPSHVQITGPAKLTNLESFHYQSQLRNLNVSNQRIESLAQITRFPYLATLDISSNRISDPNEFRFLSGLKLVNLSVFDNPALLNS